MMIAPVSREANTETRGRVRPSAALWLCLALAAASLAAVSGSVRAAEAPEPLGSALGNYLAGQIARSGSDSRDAAAFFAEALKRDPTNETALEAAFISEMASGDFSSAVAHAETLSKEGKAGSFAMAVLGTRAFKAKNYAEALTDFGNLGSNPVAELSSMLARAWTMLAQGKGQEAVDSIDVGRHVQWAQEYVRFHRALIADLAGKPDVAQLDYDAILKSDKRTLRFALAAARHAAHQGDIKLARTILKDHTEASGGEGHPVVRALMKSLDTEAGRGFLITSPSEGLAEVFYGLGEALAGDGMVRESSVYLQTALMVEPKFDFAIAALANVHEATHHEADAIADYERIERKNAFGVAIEVRRAIDLNTLDRVDEAKALLERVIADHPTEVEPVEVMGNILRSRKDYDGAIAAFTRAIELIRKPEKRHWAFWYSRGTCYERVKKWPLAEADFKRSLELAPDQPIVLNYLGYSWVDQNVHLKQGMALIERAVQLKPDDGFIVDSLGWAHYRLGNYKEATRYLERAVELRPDDPTLNDHLGDAYWHVDRKREAKFQWEQALTLKPEPEDVERIKAKIANGLFDERAKKAGAPAAAAKSKGPLKSAAVKRRSDGGAAPKPN